MSADLELATAAVAADGGVAPRSRRARAVAAPAVVHTECLNCGAPLHGRFCADCGQGVDDHHRSILHLIREWVEDLTHFDGRLMRTLPALFLRPGTLARDHFEGRRQRHVPPLRLFFVSLLLFMLALEGATHRGHATGQSAPHGKGPAAASPAPTLSFPGGTFRIAGDADASTKPGEQALDQMRSETGKKGRLSAFRSWVGERGKKALASKEYFRSVIFEWAHRLAVLLLPIFAGLLTLCYVYRRRFFVYDHLVVAMHFLSFVFLLWGVTWLLPNPVSGPALILSTLWTPVNLFMTLRGAYGSSLIGATVKALFLWLATVLLFAMMVVAVIFVALGQI